MVKLLCAAKSVVWETLNVDFAAMKVDLEHYPFAQCEFQSRTRCACGTRAEAGRL